MKKCWKFCRKEKEKRACMQAGMELCFVNGILLRVACTAVPAHLYLLPTGAEGEQGVQSARGGGESLGQLCTVTQPWL